MTDWDEPGIKIIPNISELFPNLPQVHSLEVSKEYYKQGVGSMLLQICEDSAKERGYPDIGLGIDVNNESAISLYHKWGYNKIEVNNQDTYKISWETQNDSGEMNLFLMTKSL